jgi:hypothetical protein
MGGYFMVELVSSGIATLSEGSSSSSVLVENIPDNAASILEMNYKPTLSGTRFYFNFRDSSNNDLRKYYNLVRFYGVTSRDSSVTSSTTGTTGDITHTPLTNPTVSNSFWSTVRLIIYNYGTDSPSTVSWFSVGAENFGQSHAIFRMKNSTNTGFAPVSKFYMWHSNGAQGSSSDFNYRLTKIRDIDLS